MNISKPPEDAPKQGVTVTDETLESLAADAIAEGEREGNNSLLVFGLTLKAALEQINALR